MLLKLALAVLAVLGFTAAALGDTQVWTLQKALDYASTHNPDTRMAEQRLAIARAGLEQADSAFWPHLQFQSSYTRTDNPMLAFGSILDQRAYNYGSPPNFNGLPQEDDLNVGGVVTVPLYAGGKLEAGRDQAQAGSRAQRQDLAAVKNEIAFEVVRAYEEVVKTRLFTRAAREAAEGLQEDLGIARKRMQGGSLLRSDVLDLEVRLAQAQEDELQASNAISMSILALQNLLGVENEEMTIEDSVPDASIPDNGDFQMRPELRANEEREAAAAAGVRQAQGGYLPQVDAFGSLEHDYGWISGGNGNSYTAGVMLKWDLWDGFANRAKTREAQASLESIRESKRKLHLALDLELEEARLNLQDAVGRLAVADKAVDQAVESVRLMRNRFEQGAAIPSQLIDAETALMNARMRRDEARADHRVAVAALRKALALPQLDTPNTTP